MSESTYIAQTSFVERSRYRDPNYVPRKIPSVRQRTFNDINSPRYISRQKLKINRIAFRKKFARLVLSNEVVVTNVFQSPVHVTRSTTVKNESSSISKILKAIRPNNLTQSVTAILAALIIATGVYFSFLSWQNNQAVHAQAAKLTAEANNSPSGNTANAISTVKPTSKTYAAYAVAPNYPKYLRIPSIGVDAIVGQAGLLANGALGTPRNVYYTDWYTGSAEPGQPGATLIDGHVSSWTAHGVFYDLHTLKPGAAIQIVKGDNSVVNYQVVKTQTYNSNDVNMQAAITPVDSSVSGLNLITCTGQVLRGTSEFNQRVIVFAKEVR